MNRTLQPSRRPLIALGMLFAPLSVFGLYPYVKSGFRPDLLASAAAMPLIYLVLMALIYSTRVAVSDKGVTITSWYVLKHFIAFSDIAYSSVQLLAERDWPVSISLYGENRATPLGRIGLKTVRKEDASWLCSLPELRAVVHPGLTRQT